MWMWKFDRNFYVNDILYKQSDFVFLTTFQMGKNHNIWDGEVISKFLKVIQSDTK